MTYYICIGLGVFLALSAVDKANPHADLKPWQTIGMFLVTLFIWPLSVLANYLLSMKVRRLEAELQKVMDEEMNKTSNVVQLRNDHEES